VRTLSANATQCLQTLRCCVFERVIVVIVEIRKTCISSITSHATREASDCSANNNNVTKSITTNASKHSFLRTHINQKQVRFTLSFCVMNLSPPKTTTPDWYLQTCRGYEISHSYLYPYPQIVREYPLGWSLKVELWKTFALTPETCSF